MNQEIKAGQTWHGDGKGLTAEVKHVSDGYVFYIERRKLGHGCANGTSEKDFLANYYLKPAPKTRPITKDDVMKMLAENPVLFIRNENDSCWFLMTTFSPSLNDNGVKGCRFSHNPFATNPVIVGPEIEAVEWN